VLLGAVIAAYAPSLQMRVVRRPDTPGPVLDLLIEMSWVGRLDEAGRAALRAAGRALVDAGSAPLRGIAAGPAAADPGLCRPHRLQRLTLADLLER
jgi:hypothetical protein